MDPYTASPCVVAGTSSICFVYGLKKRPPGNYHRTVMSFQHRFP